MRIVWALPLNAHYKNILLLLYGKRGGGGGGDPSSGPTCGSDDPHARLSLADPTSTARAPAAPPNPLGSPRGQPRTGECVPRDKRRDDMYR